MYCIVFIYSLSLERYVFTSVVVFTIIVITKKRFNNVI